MRYLKTTKRPASRSLKWLETSSETTTMTCEALPLIYCTLLISIVGLKYCNSCISIMGFKIICTSYK